MPSVTIELTAELAGRMCSFVHTAMIDGGRADRRASRVIAMMRSIIPTGSMEASETAPAIDIAAVGGGYRGGGRCSSLCVLGSGRCHGRVSIEVCAFFARKYG